MELKYKCLECNRSFNTFNGYRHHISKSHMPYSDYFDKYIEPEIDHKCPFCNNKRKWGRDNYYETCGNKECIKKLKKQKLLEKYGTSDILNTEEMKLKRKSIFQERFNSNSPFGSKEVRLKSVDTLIKNYGVDVPARSVEIKNKMKDTCLRKYKVSHLLKTEIIQDKIKLTCLTRYGVTHPLKSPEIYNKFVDTMKSRYGVTNPSYLNDIIAKRYSTRFLKNLPKINKSIDEWNKNLSSKFNIYRLSIHVYRCLKCNEVFISNNYEPCPKCGNCIEVNKFASNFESNFYFELLTLFDESEIKIHDRTILTLNNLNDYCKNDSIELGRFNWKSAHEIDFYIPKYNLAIECDGTYWHKNDEDDELKTELCNYLKINLIHIDEREFYMDSMKFMQLISSYINNSVG